MTMQPVNRQLLHRWWTEADDNTWLREFLAARGVLRWLKRIVSAGGFALGIAALCIPFSIDVARTPLALTAAWALTAGAFAWAMYWWLFPWPSTAVSTAMFILADAGIVLGTLLHQDPAIALSTTPLFALTGAYIAFFHGPRGHLVHLVIALSTIAVFAVAVAMSPKYGWPVALCKAVIAISVTCGVLPFLQFGYWVMRNTALDSFRDPLTRTANRRGLDEYVSRIDRAGDDYCLSVILIDLDGFKEINDRYGHSVGDEVLVRTADRIASCVRSSAIVARVGGEEFAVVDFWPPTAAKQVAERIRVAIAAPTDPPITASIGIASEYPASAGQLKDLLARADTAMYTAKRIGGNRISVHSGVQLREEPSSESTASTPVPTDYGRGGRDTVAP